MNFWFVVAVSGFMLFFMGEVGMELARRLRFRHREAVAEISTFACIGGLLAFACGAAIFYFSR